MLAGSGCVFLAAGGIPVFPLFCFLFLLSAMMNCFSQRSFMLMVQLLYAFAGGFLCLMMKTELLSLPAFQMRLFLSALVLPAASLLFCLLTRPGNRRSAFRALLGLVWLVACLGQPQRLRAFCIGISFLATLFLYLKAAGINPADPAFWKERREGWQNKPVPDLQPGLSRICMRMEKQVQAAEKKATEKTRSALSSTRSAFYE